MREQGRPLSPERAAERVAPVRASKAKKISVAVRIEIACRYWRGEGTQQELARAYAVSDTLVNRYVHQYRPKSTVE